MGVRAEDFLPDDVSSREFNGVVVRKGSMGAAIANAKILASPKSTVQEKEAAKEMLKELAPALVAIGVHEHLTWKNPEIQKIFDAVAEEM